MKVYIVMTDPYRDNGFILGVYRTETEAIVYLKAERDKRNVYPKRHLVDEDEVIIEWDLETNTEGRGWGLCMRKNPSDPTWSSEISWEVVSNDRTNDR